MRVAGYAIVAALVLWVALGQNGIIPGPRATLRRMAAMGGTQPPKVAPEVPADVLPYCQGCPDEEACSQGGCHLDGGPVRPVAQREPGVCTHEGKHEWQGDGFDPMGITGTSCEDVKHVDVRGEGNRFKTGVRIQCEAVERADAEVKGEDLSFLKGAGPGERQEWVLSWAGKHHDVPRSEIVRLLVKHAGITDRQARRDVSSVLRPPA